MAIEKFVFSRFSLRLCQRFREKPAIVSVHRTSRAYECCLVHHAYFAGQLSLLRCAVRYKRVRTRLRIGRRRRNAYAHAACPFHERRKSLLCRAKRKKAFSMLPDSGVHLTTSVFAYATASALLTKCNSFPMPRFRQTCGRKCRTPCGGRPAKRGLLNNSQ